MNIYIYIHVIHVCAVCDSSSVPMNGEVTVSDDQMTVVFACDDGYTMVGEKFTQCLTDGTGWNSTAPSCGRHFLIS